MELARIRTIVFRYRDRVWGNYNIRTVYGSTAVVAMVLTMFHLKKERSCSSLRGALSGRFFSCLGSSANRGSLLQWMMQILHDPKYCIGKSGIRL